MAHTATNGNGNGHGNPFAGLPPWARVVALVGAPTALLAFVLWVMTMRMMGDIAAIDERLEAHGLVTTAAAAMVADSRNDSKALLALIRQLCVNTARTPDQLRECAR